MNAASAPNSQMIAAPPIHDPKSSMLMPLNKRFTIANVTKLATKLTPPMRIGAFFWRVYATIGDNSAMISPKINGTTMYAQPPST